MDILSQIPFLSKKTAPEAPATGELTEADRLAEEKADRVAFHREHVRNGPVKFRHIADGAVRRANQRAIKRSTKRARRVQLKNYHETQRIAATVRGQLQLAGALPYVVERELDREQQVRSVVWLVVRFGTEKEDGTVSLAYDDVVAALNSALKFYGQAVGLPGLVLSEDYVVPVYEAEDDEAIEFAEATA